MGSNNASHDERIKGSIEPEKVADLVVFSQDILSINPVEIANAKVMMTIAGDPVVY